jgi:hypothetical protein
LFERYPGAAVGDLDGDSIAGCGRDRTPYCATGLGEFEGIGQQIHDHLLQVLGIERGRDGLV